jgi:hypothetical protein
MDRARIMGATAMPHILFELAVLLTMPDGAAAADDAAWTLAGRILAASARLARGVAITRSAARSRH